MATINVQDIQHHAEVVGSDHQHVGTVDHLDGQDKIKLAKMINQPMVSIIIFQLNGYSRFKVIR